MSSIYITSIDITSENKVLVNGFTAYGGMEVFISPVIYIDKPSNGIWDYTLTYKFSNIGTAMLMPFRVITEFTEDEDANGLRILFPHDHQPIQDIVLMKVNKVDKFTHSSNNVITPVGANHDETSGHLIIDLQYSGGCVKHDFKVEWDGLLRKSNPPQYIINIVDISPKDDCEMLLRTQLRVDISNKDIVPVRGSTLHVKTPSYGGSIPVVLP